MTAVIPDWHRQAVCQYVDPELFFPELGETALATADQADEAHGVCLGCPVRRECLAHGLGRERFGIWGGLSERELARERNRRTRRPLGEAIAEADARYYRRQARRLAAWAHEAELDAWLRAADETEEIAA